MKCIIQLVIKLCFISLLIGSCSNFLLAQNNCDVISDGSFSNGGKEWMAVVEKKPDIVENPFINRNAYFNIEAVGEEKWSISLQQRFVEIKDKQSYQIRFRAKAGIERSITVAVSDVGDVDNGYGTLSQSGMNFNLTTEWAVYEYAFNAVTTNYAARIIFMLGAQAGDVYIDDVSMKKLNCCLPAGTPCDDRDACTIDDKEDGNCNCVGNLTTNNQIINGDFTDDISPWFETIMTKYNAVAEFIPGNGEVNFKIDQIGTMDWHVSLQQRSLSIKKGQQYRISFKAKATANRNINIKISDVDNGFSTYFSEDVALTEEFVNYSLTFPSWVTDDEVRIIFNMGLDTPDVTIDNVSFEEFYCASPCNIYGEACDDGDPCTINDKYDASCNCVSYKTKDQYINNGNFSNQFAGWVQTTYGDAGVKAKTNFNDRMAHFKIENDGTENWHISLEQRDIPFVAGETYAIDFIAKATISRGINLKISDYPNAELTYFNQDETLTNDWKAYHYIYKPLLSDDSTRIIFNMGVDKLKTGINEIFIDDVSITNTGCSVYNPVQAQDSSALVKFYQQNCTTDCELNWYLSRPVNTWEGVEIENGRVVALNVASKGLSGDIPYLNLPALKQLDLSNNNFDSTLANFSNLNQLQYLNVSKNQLSFKAVGEHFYANLSIENFKYSPQYTGCEETYVLEEGETYTLKLPGDLSFLNNTTLQWKHNDEIVLGANTQSHLIQNLNKSSIGVYTLHISNESMIPGLEIVLQPQNVLMNGYDMQGQPIFNNEIMVLFNDEVERDAFFAKYLNSGELSFKCDCNRLLYLFRFKSNEEAARVLLEINGVTELVKIRGEPDGDPNAHIELESISTNLQMWKWPQSKQQSLDEPVSVYILDSGLDVFNLENRKYLLEEAPSNGCFEQQTSGYSFVTNQSKISIHYKDNIGHGTYGYNAIVGQNENNLKVIPVKIFNKNGEGSLFHFICGLFHSIDNNADIINVSGGFKEVNSSILETALQMAQQKGIFITTSAGNDATDIDQSPQYPAYYAGQSYQKERLDIFGNSILDIGGKPVFDEVPYDNIISVASLNSEGKLSEFSNYGAKSVTLSAYGENLLAKTLNGRPKVYSGTSMATFYTTRELTNELAKDKSRTYQEVWRDFETNCLVLNDSTKGKTITGKQINVALQNPQLRNGISEKQEQFNIFPNPSNGNVNIEFTCLNYNSEIKITIYNTLGKEVLKQKTGCSSLIQITTDGLSKGTYFVSVSTIDEIKHGKLLIK